MDEHLDEVFEQIKSELNVLHYRWKLYRDMFASNQHRIDLINRTSSNVFVEFQRLVIDYMVMSLSKLTDPARMKRNENLSFHYLVDKVREHDATELAEKMDGELLALTEACESFRRIRNKRVAHNDLATSLGAAESPLPGVSRAQVETALEHCRNIMNTIELHFKDSSTLYEHLVLPLTNDGRSLLIWLQKGLAYESLEDSGEIEQGKWREIGPID